VDHFIDSAARACELVQYLRTGRVQAVSRNRVERALRLDTQVLYDKDLKYCAVLTRSV
jgi:hypothetical protein